MVAEDLPPTLSQSWAYFTLTLVDDESDGKLRDLRPRDHARLRPGQRRGVDRGRVLGPRVAAVGARRPLRADPSNRRGRSSVQLPRPPHAKTCRARSSFVVGDRGAVLAAARVLVAPVALRARAAGTRATTRCRLLELRTRRMTRVYAVFGTLVLAALTWITPDRLESEQRDRGKGHPQIGPRQSRGRIARATGRGPTRERNDDDPRVPLGPHGRRAGVCRDRPRHLRPWPSWSSTAHAVQPPGRSRRETELGARDPDRRRWHWASRSSSSAAIH